jgi:hypothetical protein
MCKETPLFHINLIARYMRRARVRPCCWYLCLFEQGTLNGHIKPPKNVRFELGDLEDLV